MKEGVVMLRLQQSLLSKREILTNRVKVRKSPVIYFLIKDRKIVYVGSSLYPEQRLSKHIRRQRNRSGPRGWMEFDSYTVLHYKESRLKEIEQAYIRNFKPYYNRTETKEAEADG